MYVYPKIIFITIAPFPRFECCLVGSNYSCTYYFTPLINYALRVFCGFLTVDLENRIKTLFKRFLGIDIWLNQYRSANCVNVLRSIYLLNAQNTHCLSARTASQCRRAYILPLWFFLFPFFFRRLISGVTEWISTIFGHIFTYDCYLKNLVRTPGRLPPRAVGKTAIWTDFEVRLKVSLQPNMISTIGKKSSIYSRPTPLQAPKIW